MNSKKKPPAMGVRRDPLASLRMADMMISKPTLPAEIIAQIVDHLSAPDMIGFARVSRRMQEMIYDDARWIQRLRRMGCWNDVEARKRAGEAHMNASHARRRSTLDKKLVNGKGRPDVTVNGQQMSSTESPRKSKSEGFDIISFAAPVEQTSQTLNSHDISLNVIKNVRSVRGQARQEYGKVHRALARFYKDALLADSPHNTIIVRAYSLPEEQAVMFAQVRAFSFGDFSPGMEEREQRLDDLVRIFDTSALLEFRKGYEYKDIQGRMRQYAHVMHTLNGGQSSVDLFLSDNKLIAQRKELGSVEDCVDYSSGYGQLSLEKVNAYFERLGNAYQQEAAIVQAVFPQATEVSLLLLEKIAEEILSPFLTALFEDARNRSKLIYLRVISGSLHATSQFVQDFALPRDSDEDVIIRASTVLIRLFAPHLETYLDEELAFFQQKANSEVGNWDKALSEQAASTEDFLMSNINRQADKKDFMSSFKKVVMMPVNILPSFSSSSSKAASKPTNGELTSRSTTPVPRTATPNLPAEAPTDELAAKAAVMTARLENIKSLFSIEIALNLVHAAKSSLERAAQFIALGGHVGDLAREKCSQIFVILLDAVGNKHVRTGFDKAVEHLSSYNPRSGAATNGENHSQPTVAPLTMFLELVNVGDLIQQMLDVFFEQELIGMGISKRDDFLSASVKEKRKFEQMLDERVASGLGKGIDVLMDEVEYLCATEQSPQDYNPSLQVFDADQASKRISRFGASADIDVRPTPPCLHIIDLIGRHVSMLVGSTEKTLLDVFVQEVAQRLFQVLTKHIKRQRISPLGAIRLLSDLTQYSSFISSYRNPEITLYFNALREVGQIYLFEGKTNREIDEMSQLIADAERYRGVFTVEEVVEFAERRADWLTIKSKVEGRVKGEGCLLM